MLKPTVGIELLGVENQTEVPEARTGDLLYGKLSALARIASVSFRTPNIGSLPQGLAGEMSCQHFAGQSWLHPSPWP